MARRQKAALELLSDIGSAAFDLRNFSDVEIQSALAFMRTANGPLFEWLTEQLAGLTLQTQAATIDELRDFIGREGYRRCDVPACNCNSFHGGHAMARLTEIHDVLMDAGVEMNGKTILGGVREQAATIARLTDGLRQIQRVLGDAAIPHDPIAVRVAALLTDDPAELP